MDAAEELIEDLVVSLDMTEGGLVLLRLALENGDPQRELFLRIDDMLRETRELRAKAEAVS